MFNKTHRFQTSTNSEYVDGIGYIDSLVFNVKVDSFQVKLNNDTIFYNSSIRKPYIDYMSESGIIDNIRFNYYVKNDSIFTFYLRDLNDKYVSVFKINKRSKIGDTLHISSKNYSTFKEEKLFTFLDITDSVKVFDIKTYIGKDSVINTVYLSKNYGFLNGITRKPGTCASPVYSPTLLSIKELDLGIFPEKYMPSAGDTIVWGTKSGPSNVKTKVYVFPNDSSDYVKELYKQYGGHNDYEVFHNNSFYLISGSTCFIGHPLISIFDEKIGITKSEFFYMGSFVGENGILYYKGSQGEFGDRVQLKNLTLNIDDEEIIEKGILYPNPAKDVLYLSKLGIPNQVEILDVLGRILYSQVVSESKINIEELSAGVYMLKVNNLTYKFIKE